MCKKLAFISYFILLFCLIRPGTCADTNSGLMGWWPLDGHAIDVSGNDHHGTINGTPQFGPGMYGQALELDGDDFVNIDGYKGVLGTNPWSITAWFKTTDVDDHRCLINWGSSPAGQRIELRMMSGTGILRANHGNGNVNTNTAVNDGEWHHIALTVIENATCSYPDMILYLDGQDDTVQSTDPDPLDIIANTDVSIGYRGTHGDRFWIGSIDEVRMYDRVLSSEEVLQIMEEAGEPYPFATSPDPADGALIENMWASLGWSPGAFAVSHDVYIGDSFEDVDSGAESTFQSNQSTTTFTLGFPGFAYPDGLVPGTTYYWRIDEVNENESNSPWKGKIWSFSVPPTTAYFPEPADGAESVDLNVKLRWTGGFGAKLHYVYFGDNFEDVNNAAGALPLGSATYDPGPLEMAKTYYWRVDEFDVAETYKGEVWSFTTEGAVGSPNPAKGAMDITQTPVLTWVPGVFADTHEVYFGTDPASLELKGSGNLGAESFEPGQLEWNTTYYWRVDEANNTNANSPWTGPLWSFTTANFLIIDDMESYNDINEGEPGSNRIYLAWIDGFENPALNGSVVGNLDPPIAEQTIVHNGNQSMPMAYDNSVGKSEATLTLTSNRDWTVNGVNTLTIWFRGSSSNSAEQMYVTLNGNARVDHDDSDATKKASWTQWNIDLQAFADQGVNLANVNSITVGLSSGTGGTGIMYFDDIRLYAP